MLKAYALNLIDWISVSFEHITMISTDKDSVESRVAYAQLLTKTVLLFVAMILNILMNDKSGAFDDVLSNFTSGLYYLQAAENNEELAEALERHSKVTNAS